MLRDDVPHHETAQTSPETNRIGTTTRRSFVVGTTAAAAAAVLAACTDQGGGPRRDTAAPGDVVGKVTDIPVGGGKVYGGASLVVTQPTEGEYVGLSAICTHQSCTVRGVAAGEIECGCHGSRFDLTGQVVKGPATKPLPAMAIKIVDGEITIA